MQLHHSDISLATATVAIGFGKLFDEIQKINSISANIEHVLADLSYIVALIAGAVTIYYKIKNKG